MRLGLLSDVHGNLPALEVALAELSRAGVERHVCAGDLVGYGPYPNECVERIGELDAVCVMGNHDLVAVGREECDGCGELARTTLRWTREVLTDQTRAWLDRLPLQARLEGVLVTHGAVGDPWRYLVTAKDAIEELDRLAGLQPGARILVAGHTHHPLAVARSERGTFERRTGAVVLDPAQRWLLNPGSVGQSRERRPVVRFAVLDLERATAELRLASYDVRRCRDALRRHGLPVEACHPRPRPWRRRAGAVRRALRRRLLDDL